ncbi:MAG: cyclic nucleotide-binding domain-containing protein [Bacteroidales bacterium]|nr:cyclic nucleotide-binding domain-containing protein [Bacteroidales bacterium]
MTEITPELLKKFLKNIPLFENINDEIIEKISHKLNIRSYGVQEIIFSTGDEANGLFIVKNGAVRIHNESYEFSLLGPGDYFGEYSLIEEDRRQLSATAETDVTLYLLKIEDFNAILMNKPLLFKSLLKILINRLRDKNILEESMVKSNIEIKVQKKKEEEKSQKLADLILTKDKLLSIIAHDLKGPLGLIMSFSDIILDSETLTPDKQREFTKYINTSSKVVFQLLENLLDWARSQTGGIILHSNDLSVKKIVDENLLLLKNLILNKNIQIVTTINQDVFYADYNTINTVIRNLLSNAIKYTPNGGTITISSVKNENKCNIAIADNGVGMDDEHLSKLFKPNEQFSQPGTNDEKGTGLGLLVVYEFVKANDGDLSVESKLNVGTSFLITLPIK